MWRECRERARLENAVVDAIEELYEPKLNDRQARRERQRDAVRRLEEHVEIHRCRDPLKTPQPGGVASR
jgi:type I site-specific restriction endonuclease